MASPRSLTEVESLAVLLRSAIEGTERLHGRIDSLDARLMEHHGRIGTLEGMAKGLEEARAFARARGSTGEYALSPPPAPEHRAEPVRLELWPPRAVGFWPVFAMVILVFAVVVAIVWALASGVGSRAADHYFPLPPAPPAAVPAPMRAKE